MSSKETLSIAYCNVRGLDDCTFNSCISSIHSNHFQLYCLAETWFSNKQRYNSNSFFLTDSLYPLNPHHNRRQDGGLLIFASPSIKQYCTTIYKSRYSIVIEIAPSKTKIAFVYYPPSLTNQEISTDLQSMGPIDLLTGDINVRLGQLSGDTTSTASLRKSTIYSYISSSSLCYYRNENLSICSRTDHVFSKLPDTQWIYQPTLPFQTDHGRIELKVKLLQTRNQCKMGSPRYDFKPLYNPAFVQDFLSRYENTYSPLILSLCESALQTCCYSMILPNTISSQEIIDETYSSIIDLLHSLLQDTLPTYDAHSIKSKPDKLLDNSTYSSKSTLDIIRTFKRSQRSLAETSPIISSSLDTSPLEECANHYQNLFDSDSPVPSIERQNDVQFGLLFTNAKIESALKTYLLSKSMGPDGIHTIVYRVLTNSPRFISSLSALFQLFASTSIVPTDWSNCNLHLLIKKTDLPKTASNTRPISLSNILRRIFEKILLDNWLNPIHTDNRPDSLTDTSWMHLDSSQAGFRRGYSTTSQLLLSDEISRRKNPFSIFLDIKGAFDNVNWTKLNALLVSKNCPPTHRNLILSLMCKPSKLQLSVNQSEQKTISPRKGVFQGGGISAFIFAIYIDPLAKSINTNSPPYRPLGLFYADDVQLKPTNETIAQKALDICTKYGEDYDMEWSIPKCAIVGNCNSRLVLAGNELQTTSQYKYLGAIHRAHGIDFKTTYEMAANKQLKLIYALTYNNWHPKIRLIIYRTFIRPISEYIAALTWIWAHRDLPLRSNTIKLMESTHKTAIKWIFNREHHLKIMDYLSGLGPYYYRMECLRSSLANSLSNMISSNPLLAAKDFYLLSTSKHFILPFCFKSDYLTEFQKLKHSNPMKPLTYKTWTTKKLIAESRITARNSALISYLGPYHPLKMKSIFNLNQKSFFDILAWRTNSCFSNCHCLCGSSFRRSHLDCVLHTNEIYNQILESNAYAKSLSLVSSHAAPHYSVLDFLLNEQKFNVFLSLLAIIRLSIA
jgi:hypothetical protein